MRLKRLASGNPGDVRPVGKGVSELRIDMGPGYRVYYRKGACAVERLEGSATMSKTTSRPFDSADYIDTPEAVAAYLEAALEDGDAQIIAATLGDIARSKGMAMIAERTGLAREELYKSLSADGNPRLTTLLGVLKAMGLRLSVTADGHEAA